MVLEGESVSPVAEDVIGTRLHARRAAPATAREEDEAKVRTDDKVRRVEAEAEINSLKEEMADLKEAIRSFCKRLLIMERERGREATKLLDSGHDLAAGYNEGRATGYEICRKYLEFLLGEN